MRINRDNWLLNKPIAHRGLWGDGIVENSITAYLNAVKCGYPIEIDLYPTSDGEIVCFHDATLQRMTGESGKVCEKNLNQLKELRLLNTEEQIPTLKEVLSAVNGKVPLLIEFKNQKNNSYVDKAVKILKNYNGEFAVQSFNPFIISRIKKLAPHFIRGILSSFTPDTESKKEKFVVKNMPFNFLCKPDFISYEFSGLPLKKSKRKNRPVIAWTVTDKTTADNISPYCDNIIFEKFVP